jgi:tRNA U34 5-carboxymethylaminomethyl modifying GTPase MnmE/TrmE
MPSPAATNANSASVVETSSTTSAVKPASSQRRRNSTLISGSLARRTNTSSSSVFNAWLTADCAIRSRVAGSTEMQLFGERQEDLEVT